MDAELFFNYLRGDEGFRMKPYLDTAGHPTVATGFNLDRADARAKIAMVAPTVDFDDLRNLRAELTAEQANALDLIVAKEQAAIVRRLFKGFDIYPPAIQIILTDMSYMGEGTFSKFKTFIGLIEAGKYVEAGRDIAHTPWYSQVGLRGPRTVRGLMTGRLRKHDDSGPMDLQPEVTSVVADATVKPDLKALAKNAAEAVQRLRDAIEAG